MKHAKPTLVLARRYRPKHAAPVTDPLDDLLEALTSDDATYAGKIKRIQDYYVKYITPRKETQA